MQPTTQACSVRLFGVEPIGADMTLGAITSVVSTLQGPPVHGGPVTIVEGWIRATAAIADGGPVSPDADPPTSRSPLTLTAAQPVKLRVSSPQYSAPVVIDSDRRIDLPSSGACVDVLTPAGWLVDPALGAVLEAPNGAMIWNVWLQVKICCAQGQTNYPALLTEQFTADEEAPTLTVRPRSARRLFVTSNAAGAIDLSMFQGPGSPFHPAGLLRRSLGGVVDLGPLPAFTHLQCPAIVGAPRMTYAWDVVP